MFTNSTLYKNKKLEMSRVKTLKSKQKSKFIASLMLTLALFMCMAPGKIVHAGTSETSLERGIKYFCWSKSTITWSYDWSRITSYDADQQRSGILVQLQGINKLNASTSSKYIFNSKTSLLAGAVISGFTIGWNTDVVDRITIDCYGNADWEYGI